jgi:pimeloyl-ACP methyl ester carboxylesterase
MPPIFHTLSLTPPEVSEAHKMAYWLWGSADAPCGTLLCVHGLTRNGRDFDYLASALSSPLSVGEVDEPCELGGGLSQLPHPHPQLPAAISTSPSGRGYYQVFTPDIVGRGKSDWITNTAAYNVDTYIVDLLALLDSRKITQVDWVGTSMGGIIGMRLAAERPNLIRKLVLNDIGGVISAKGLQRINNYAGLQMVFADRAAAEAYLRSSFATFGITQEEHWQHMLEHSFTQLSNGDYQLAYDPGILDPMRDPEKKLANPVDIPLWPWWDAITCPVLVIRGETSDILTAETLEEMVQRKPETTATLTIPNCGHAPALMEDVQIKFIRDWLLA